MAAVTLFISPGSAHRTGHSYCVLTSSGTRHDGNDADYLRRSRSSHSINSRTVSPVRAPQHIEGVADHWHCPQHTIERDVAEHTHDDVARCAELNLPGMPQRLVADRRLPVNGLLTLHSLASGHCPVISRLPPGFFLETSQCPLRC